LIRIDLKKISEAEHLLKSTPQKEHYNTVISQDAIFYKEDKPVGLYIKIDSKRLKGIRKAALTTKLNQSSRTRGLPTKSSVFGALPRIARRNDFCRFSEKTKSERDNLYSVFDFAKELQQVYEDHLPEHLQRDVSEVNQNVNGDYKILEESPFLTANINVNHAIKYHRDTGNFKGNLSNVMILKHGITGGELVFPEYGIALSQDDGYLSIFDGQKEIHGVMPISQIETNPYRASIVYYSLEQMKHCYPYKEELARLQKKASERALKRKGH